MPITGYEIDFLPVGEGEKSGDAIAMRYRDELGDHVIIYDGGTQASGEALVNHVLTHYRTTRVEHVINSHPDADHCSGLRVVIDNLQVDNLWMHKPWEHSAYIRQAFHDGRITYKSLSERIQKALNAAVSLHNAAEAQGIIVNEPFAFQQIGPFRVLSPTLEWYQELLVEFRSTPEVRREWTDLAGPVAAVLTQVAKAIMSTLETWDIETLSRNGETSAENESSVVLWGQFAGDGVLLTGDAGRRALDRVALYAAILGADLPACQVVQIPHHGSRRNVCPDTLNAILGPIRPRGDNIGKVAFASASSGSSTHPRRIVTNAFTRRGRNVYVTRGRGWRYYKNMPVRDGWNFVEAEPFHSIVED